MLFHLFDRILRAPDGEGGGAVSMPSGPSGPSGGSVGSESVGGTPAPVSRPGEGGLSDAPEEGFDSSGFGADNFDDVAQVDASSLVAQPPPAVVQTPPTPQAVPQVPQTQSVAQSQPKVPTSTSNISDLANDPRAFMTALAQNEEALVNAIAQEHFALSDADREALETDYVAALPKLAGRVMFKAMHAMMGHLMNTVPRMITMHQQAQESGNRARELFYSSWPQLKAHEGEIIRIGQMYRQMNPGASSEQFIRDVGMMVSQTVGQQANMAARGQPNRPFSPATGAGGPATNGMVRNEPQNPFAGLGIDFD